MIELLDTDVKVPEDGIGIIHTPSSRSKLASAQLPIDLKEAKDNINLKYKAYLKYALQGNIAAIVYLKGICKQLGLNIYGEPIEEFKDRKIYISPPFKVLGKEYEGIEL